MGRKRILVVDDEPDIVRSLSIRLKAKGYDVLTASDGALGTLMALKENPDLIILDIGMPAGNGHVVAKRLRENANTAAVPIIFLTARTANEDYQQARKSKVDKYITKPYQPDILLLAIEDLIGVSGSVA